MARALAKKAETSTTLLEAAKKVLDDAGFIDTSFPNFLDLMNGLGAAIRPAP